MKSISVKSQILGRSVRYFKEIASTNDLACRMARVGYEEGTLIIAEHQTAGKGRLGRSWLSPEGGVYLSLILRPMIEPDSMPILTMLAGVATAKAIRRITNLEAVLKWPNDILINNKKVSGILAEMEVEAGIPHFVILGIGINANIETGILRLKNATSLMDEMGEGIDRRELIKELLVGIEDLYLPFKEHHDHSHILREWEGLDSTFGRMVKVKTLTGVLEGKAEGIDKDGAMRILLPNGEIKRLKAGEVIS